MSTSRKIKKLLNETAANGDFRNVNPFQKAAKSKNTPMKGDKNDILFVEGRKKKLGGVVPEEVGGDGEGECKVHPSGKVESVSRLVERLLREQCCYIYPGARNMSTDFYDQDSFSGDMATKNSKFKKTNKDFWGESEDEEGDELEEDFQGLPVGDPSMGQGFAGGDTDLLNFDPNFENDEENDYGWDTNEPSDWDSPDWGNEDEGFGQLEDPSMGMEPMGNPMGRQGMFDSRQSRRPSWLGEELEQDNSGTGGFDMPEKSTDKWNKGSGGGEKNEGGVDLGSEDQSFAPDWDDEVADEEKGSGDVSGAPWGSKSIKGGAKESKLPKSFAEWSKTRGNSQKKGNG